MLSNQLRIQTKKYLGSTLGVADWRHLSSAISRQVLGGIIKIESEAMTTMFEAGFGHTGAVGLSHYGE